MTRSPFLLILCAACLPAQDFSDIKIEKVAGGYTFTEGPVWSREGFLLFSDVPNQNVWKLVPGEKPELYRGNSNRTNGNTFDARGNLYSCEGGARRLTRIDKKGNLEVVAADYQGKHFNAPNDVVVRKDGHIYFTDPAFGNQAEGRQLDFYGVYHIPPKGPVELIAKPEGRPNGIAISPDGKILYVANSDERNIRAYDLDSRGRATKERVLISGIDGPPDGIRVDEKGNLWITCKGVAVYTAAGKFLHRIELPETPANCTFGDPDLMTLYVTARTSVYRIRLDVKGALQY
ncbi:MAG: SMP-30/gluconolactonase/LRE family protein [Acidimicrobiia bacterium]|nr:SMP-30/gluconolactonase/LRE family protein [Acidimicrobiia bacterium]